MPSALDGDGAEGEDEEAAAAAAVAAAKEAAEEAAEAAASTAAVEKAEKEAAAAAVGLGEAVGGGGDEEMEESDEETVAELLEALTEVVASKVLVHVIVYQTQLCWMWAHDNLLRCNHMTIYCVSALDGGGVAARQVRE